MKKITKRERFESLLTIEAVKADPGMVEFINHELELLAKKNSVDKKPTAKQAVNEGIKTLLLSSMEEGKVYTITDLLKAVDGLPADMTNQRLSALMRQMYNKDVPNDPAFPVVRIEEKRKAYFMLNPDFEG
jgi:hypothetical protein